MEGGEVNWREEVEDTKGAISFLKNLMSQLQTASSSFSSSEDLRLASLYSSVGFSLKSNQFLSRASLLKQRAHYSSDLGLTKKDLNEDSLPFLPGVSLAGNDKPLTHGSTQYIS